VKRASSIRQGRSARAAETLVDRESLLLTTEALVSTGFPSEEEGRARVAHGVGHGRMY